MNSSTSGSASTVSLAGAGFLFDAAALGFAALLGSAGAGWACVCDFEVLRAMGVLVVALWVVALAVGGAGLPADKASEAFNRQRVVDLTKMALAWTLIYTIPKSPGFANNLYVGRLPLCAGRQGLRRGRLNVSVMRPVAVK